MAYSAGFTPHPKISYANAAPTGAASEAEYVEISLVRECDPARVAAALDAALPPGLDIVDAVTAAVPGGITDRLQASVWRMDLPGVSDDEARAAVQELLGRDRVEVDRMTKKGIRRFEVRAALVDLRVLGDEDLWAIGREVLFTDTHARPDVAIEGTGRVPGAVDRSPGVVNVASGSGELSVRQCLECAILRVVVRRSTPTVRPDDILAALRVVHGLAPTQAALLTRLAQGPLDEESRSVTDPFAADREVIGA